MFIFLIYTVFILVHVSIQVLWFLTAAHYLGEHMFARIINFIIFRTACPAFNTTHIQNSRWQLDGEMSSHNTASYYNTNATLTCAAGYWLSPPSSEGNPKTTQTVNCGSGGDWTPAPRACSPISKNCCENCLTSFPVFNYPFNIR